MTYLKIAGALLAVLLAFGGGYRYAAALYEGLLRESVGLLAEGRGLLQETAGVHDAAIGVK